MPQNIENNIEDIAKKVALCIYKDYKNLIQTYLSITKGGKEKFERREFAELFADAQKRYRLYGKDVRLTLQKIEDLLQSKLLDKDHWIVIKEKYSLMIDKRVDHFIAETFFNSITRKVFDSKGFDSSIEFLDFSDYKDYEPTVPKVFNTIETERFSRSVIKDILLSYNYSVPYVNIDEDADLIFKEMAGAIIAQRGGLQLDRVEFLKEAFYRNRGAFFMCRLVKKNWSMPFIIPILINKEGLFVDTVIHDRSTASIVFSFTRASFFAYTKKPIELIDFLKKMLPAKGVGELYNCIGYYRHGKTMLYRDLYRYIRDHDDEFIIAPGIKGMVMICFTLRHYNFVFKIIKDRFENPKTVTREEVIEKYEQVEINDRVGRMAYANLFEHLEFDKKLFTQELLDEFELLAKETVVITEDKVIIKHVYLERRMEPLNLYLEKATLSERCNVLLDYGYAIKELAAANIFPGDLLMKNFGVTGHNRVIFYDYDEISEITTCKFKHIPPPRNEFDEFSAQPSFSPGQNDIFPEEFENFMVPQGALRELFKTIHGDLFDARYWRSIQKRIEKGELVEFYAYDENKRFNQEYAIIEED